MTTTATNFNVGLFDFLKEQTTNENIFVIDLKDATLTDIIKKMVEIKGVSHPTMPKSYSAVITHIHTIEMMCHIVIKPEMVTDIFYEKFKQYLREYKHLANSTINNLCGQIITALGWGALHGAKVSPTYQCYDREKEDIVKVVLSPSTLARIYYFDIDNIKGVRRDCKETLKKVRDTLVLSACLGQRYSDMIRITPDCFDHNIFRLKQKKTQNYSVVDINRFAFDKKIAYEILERYGHYSPVTFHISRYNKLMKRLMKYVGLKEKVKVETKVNGQMKTIEFEEWEKIASHIGRRSFATYNTMRNLPRWEIMRGTGHTEEKSFKKYLVIDN